MKFAYLLIAFLVVVSVSASCENNKGCKEEDAPWCVDEKCVECSEHEHCAVDKYCYKSACKKYSDDDKFGEFCNSHTCDDADTAEVCGKCDEDDSSYSWTGACVNFKCQPCQITPAILVDTYIGIQHPDAMCSPQGTSGIKGSISKQQTAGESPNYLLQSSHAIGFMCFGFLVFFMTVMQCFIWLKIDS
ncbi:serine/threonine-protein kinase receptor [Anaeramoeba flamelloides]|uniref:Serine/threonine-protein kinase receptor n=1 Tax=Anaeramoeba flamelloides TaxID=1746091 RepID=A0ABQ8XR73_9EUKA|nr:serine/threonine-protein kinase receptor [Anaeramoeba flamelloides]